MSVLVNKDTKLLIQGITGRDGAFHCAGMLEYGTNVVAGVTPGKGGQEVHGVPVFDSVKEAKEQTQANTAIIYVPAKFAKSAILEDIEAGIDLVVCISEGVPVYDMIEVDRALRQSSTRLIGPNCPGVISPGQSKVGIMPGHIHTPGPIGVVSRSGTLTYEVVYNLTLSGIGQSSCVGLGGDPVIGTRFIDVLEMFMHDEDTKGIVIVGEIGGEDEQLAAQYIKENVTKPVVGFIAGKTAPKGKRMGHAGAIISSGGNTAAAKIAVLEEAGVAVVNMPDEMPAIFKEKLI